ncbi:MAG TPA: hypothetical protein VJU78_01470 [Chitinophagaceae bacterium]|nr:hypothetical protein [Chitinophagaceae bacterium]
MANYTMEKTAGVYHLQDVKTTASGFKLNPDGSFLFFFTYGAIDRYGSGRWAIDNDHIVLQSRPWSGKDFAWIGDKEIGQNYITTKIVGGNPVLLSHVFFSLRNGESGSWVKTNERGEAAFPLQPVTTVSLVFEFCQERYTHFWIENPTHNYFEFRFEPWLMEVFFTNFQLKISKYALSGKHPLMQGEKFVYEKG